MQFEDIRLYLMNRSQQNRLSILKVKFECDLKFVKDCIGRRRVALNGWLVGLLTQNLRLRMGYKVSLRTWRRGHVLVGNGTSLVFHPTMQFHAYFSIGRQLRNTLMTVTKSAHTRHAMSQSLISLMVRICGPQLNSTCAASNKEKATWHA